MSRSGWCRPVPGSKRMRSGNFDVVLQANCHGVPNPLLDVQAYLPHSVYTANYGNYEDPQEIELYNKMLRETDFTEAARADARSSRSMSSTPRRTRSGWCGGIGSSRTGPTSRAGRSARAISSTRIWRQSGSTNRKREKNVGIKTAASGRDPRRGGDRHGLAASGRGDAKTRRHSDLYDPGRRAAEL